MTKRKLHNYLEGFINLPPISQASPMEVSRLVDRAKELVKGLKGYPTVET